MPSENVEETILRQLQNMEGMDASALFPLVYAELRKQAGFYLAQNHVGHTLQATALVHEAYVRISGGQQLAWESKRHFFNVAAEAMRQILVDHARRKNAVKRGQGRRRVGLTHIEVADNSADPDFEELDLALQKLKAVDPRRHQVVMYRYFSGLDTKQIADLLGVSDRTVERDWKTAKMFLLAEMTGKADELELS